VNADPTDLVLRVLREPAAAAHFSLPQWEGLIRGARRANLLPRIALDVEREGAWTRVPEAPLAHLESARLQAQAQAASVRREVAFVNRAVGDLGIPVVLLKGAAYLMAGLSAARGRLFADVDILVPAERLPEVESRLMLHGWSTIKTNAYDQRYYRRWMHEIPPLKHHTRQTVLDVHHAILPTTARLKPDSAKLLAASQPIGGEPRLRILAPADLVLHSAAHLFCNEDVGNGLRDLVDLDALLREFASQAGFWERLTGRAAELDLARPLYYALRYAQRLLGTPIPSRVVGAADIGRPPSWLHGLMDELFLSILRPGYATRVMTSLARSSLYVRAHWLRMPPLLLTYHLAVKAFRREPEVPG
jgi:hypothetical protein